MKTIDKINKYLNEDSYYEPPYQEKKWTESELKKALDKEFPPSRLEDGEHFDVSFGIDTIQLSSKGTADPSEWDYTLEETLRFLKQLGLNYEVTSRRRNGFRIDLIHKGK
jgi:hypothetical protein